MSKMLYVYETALVLQFQWELDVITTESNSTFLSSMITFCGHKTFRVGLKIQPSSPATLFLVAADLNKMGLNLFGAMYSLQNRDREQMKLISSKKSQDIGGKDEIIKSSVRLYTANLKDLETTKNIFTFYIFLQSLDDQNYGLQKVDFLWKEQLWSSAVNGNLTDFQLTVDGKCFPVHKFVLATRSPVFASLLEDEASQTATESINTILRIASVDAACMEQFLKFIYTGELDGVGNSKLLQLASICRMQTLETICQGAANAGDDIDFDQMASLALSLKPITGNTSIQIKPDKNTVIDCLSTGVVLSCTWNLKWTEEGVLEDPVMSTAFEYEDEKLFRAEIETSSTSAASSLPARKGTFKVTFLSYNHRKIGLDIDAVMVFANNCNTSLPSPASLTNKMKKKQPVQGGLLHTFTSNGEFSTPLDLVFYVTVSNTVTNYGHKLVDLYHKDHLWDAAADGKLTDVELLVGKVMFPAHRSLLSARSPVFAAMFKSGMEEALTGRVRVDGVDPTTFRQFLEFLYTGTLSTWADKSKMLVMADRYQVETLVNLCKITSSSLLDIDEITEAFLS